MNFPSWFVLIDQWLNNGMGEYGVTLPFLVGALCHMQNEGRCDRRKVRNLLEQIVNNPVDGYVAEVRWCGNIDAPVISVREIDSNFHKISVGCSFHRQDKSGLSLVFSQNIMTEFGGLGCRDAKECYEKQIEYAVDAVESGCYSRRRNNNAFEYQSFDEKDIEFIDKVKSNEID